jgi:hypothetical protein
MIEPQPYVRHFEPRELPPRFAGWYVWKHAEYDMVGWPQSPPFQTREAAETELKKYLH